MPDLVNEFIDQSIQRILESSERVKKCLHELGEEEIWHRPNESSNSVGNLILHLSGNIGQYVISGLGGNSDVRSREAEFSARGGTNKEELFSLLSDTVVKAANIIRNQDEKQLTKIRSVQGFSLSGIGIIIHVTEHFSYHTGQIAFWTKLLKNKDLGFYAGVNLNTRNSSSTAIKGGTS
jgi:uncharacterized damage-inducible protein DinB